MTQFDPTSAFAAAATGDPATTRARSGARTPVN
ncbi:hypothetical protein Rrhod_1743 [Rhodococcus rhodnii LMG 5362]|uniref:Uncharacterized protein n=1 Tax=Rhodococcus rhodnii LMG 5362 TaxID=1273125 RepID=R7WNI3_9NOCA|nr:hypothetical protein Rrhod_1743 [Rhodococcus rhodnii LMG 5362]